jgi:DedD protein
MAESEEALQLKRRARRRLIGAIALVTFVVIILPLVLDKEPGPAGPPLSVQIPDQGATGFNSGAVPALPAAPVVPVPEKKAGTAAAGSKPLPARSAPAANAEHAARKAGSTTASAAAKENDKAEELRARAALNDQSWVVALDAFSDEKNVKQLGTKLSAAGVKFYTEPVKTSKGKLTRVRAGPFATREAAEKVRAKLNAMGLKPGAVTSQ